jgi:hypothetical protein
MHRRGGGGWELIGLDLMQGLEMGFYGEDP